MPQYLYRNTGTCRRTYWKLTNFATNTTNSSIYTVKNMSVHVAELLLENHKDCKEVTVLENIIKNVKTSNMFNEIEQLIEELIKTISKIRQNRETNASAVKEQKILVRMKFGNWEKKSTNILTSYKKVWWWN